MSSTLIENAFFSRDIVTEQTVDGAAACTQLRLILMSSLETMSATCCFCCSLSVVQGADAAFLKCIPVPSCPCGRDTREVGRPLEAGHSDFRCVPAPAAGGGHGDQRRLKLRGAAGTQGSSLTSSINLPVSAAKMRGTLESLDVFPAHRSDARLAHCHSGPQTPPCWGAHLTSDYLQLRQSHQVSRHTASRQDCQKYSKVVQLQVLSASSVCC